MAQITVACSVTVPDAVVAMLGRLPSNRTTTRCGTVGRATLATSHHESE
jgi:hypothetical protein